VTSIVCQTTDPNPAQPILAFLWSLDAARKLGFTPPTEHVLAEHLFRKNAKILFYSTMDGVFSLVSSEPYVDEMHDEIIQLIANQGRRRRQRQPARRMMIAEDIGLAQDISQ